MEGTRTRLRQDILDWLRDVGSEERVSLLRKLFWVYGLAGSGKSSLANTIAETIEKADALTPRTYGLYRAYETSRVYVRGTTVPGARGI